MHTLLKQYICMYVVVTEIINNNIENSEGQQ